MQNKTTIVKFSKWNYELTITIIAKKKYCLYIKCCIDLQFFIIFILLKETWIYLQWLISSLISYCSTVKNIEYGKQNYVENLLICSQP